MNSLEWAYLTSARIWSANSVDNATWEIRCKEDGLFYLIDNNRLPYNAAPFETLRGAQAWCEEREDELIEAQPVRRLAKLYHNTIDGKYWVFDSLAVVPLLFPATWKEVGSIWVTEGEQADERA